MIVGLGKTGLSCARHFSRCGIPFDVADSQPSADALDALRQIAPDAGVGDITAARLETASEIVLSPGVPRRHKAVQSAVARGIPVTGDIAMFGELAAHPIIAITGTNGKSTVTALVGELASAAGRLPGVGGNIGTPSLDLLDVDVDIYVLEVSSYQLEVAAALPSEVAVVLNLSPDHLDRYESLEEYYGTKAHIYRNTRNAVVNRGLDFPFAFPADARIIEFGADAPTGPDSFGLRSVDDAVWLCRGDELLIATSELPVRGGHNHLNALAALAIGSALDWDMSAMLDGLRRFRGLPHRCEPVGEVAGVVYINDSKATNIESTIAAVEGLAAETDSMTLLLGGIGKGADFSRLRPLIEQHVHRVLVYGQDRERIKTQLLPVPVEMFATLDEVVHTVRASSRTGDWVVLSPACASLDQFRSFEDRGDHFRRLVLGDAS